MIQVLCGPNKFGIDLQFYALRSDYLSKFGEYGVEIYDAEQCSASVIINQGQSGSLFAAKKAIIIKNPELNKELTEDWDKIIQISEVNDVILISASLDKRTAFYKKVSKLSNFKSYELLNLDQLKSWAEQYAKSKNYLLNSDAFELLVQKIGQDQYALSSEIDKLGQYNKTISVDSVDLLSASTPSATVFELITMLFKGDVVGAANCYGDLKLQKIDPSAVLALITWQMTVLSVLINNCNPLDFGYNPYVIQKSRSLLNSIDKSKFGRLVDAVLQADITIKTTKKDPDLVIEALFLKFV